MAAPEEAPSSLSPPPLPAETSPPVLVALPPLLPPLLPPSVPAIIPLPGGSATDPPSLLTTPPPSPSGADSESPVSSPPSPEQPSSPAPVAPPVDPPPVPAVSPPAPADPPPLPPEVPPPVLADPPPVLPEVPPTTPASPSLPPPETPTPENPSSPPPATPTPESPLSPPETPSTPENPSSPPPVTPSTPENPSSRPPATPSTPEGPSLPPPAAPSTPEGPSLPPPATPSTPKGHSFPPPATPSTPESPSFPPPATPSTPENPSFSPPVTPTPKNPSFPPSTTPSPTPATPLSPPATPSTPANPSSSPRSTPSTPANPSSSPPTTTSPNPESPSLSPPSTPSSSPTNPSSSPPTTPPNPEAPSSSPRTTPSRTPANPSFTPPATPSSPTPTDPLSSPPATPSSPTPANPSPETPANPSSPTTPASPSSSSPANPSSPTPANPSSATPTNPSSSPPSTPSPSSELPLPLTSPPSPNLPATPSSVPLFYPSSPSDPNSPKNPIINSAASLSSSTHAPTIRSANKSGTAAGIAIITTLVVLGVIGVLVWSIRKWKRKSAFSTGYFRQSPFNSSRISEASYPGSTKKSQIYAFQRLESDGSKHSTLQFSYEELSIATNGFSAENLLGEGGFGSVFRGRLSNGKSVAVKQLRIESGRAEREFQGEIEIISRVHHRHLVSLVGCCICNDTRLLVYDYVPNKTLHHHLHEKGRPVMNWEIRMKIALGAARGIAYLHEDCHPQIIHRDIKSSNILLDSNFDARVSDFGLAKLSEEASTHVTTRLVGTFGYLAPEYVSSGKLSAKSDVFSFGVVILELLTGREPVDSSRSLGNESLVEWARPLLSHSLETGELGELPDPKLQKSYNPSEARRMVEIAASCIRHSSSMRPHMGQVVRALDALDEPVDLTNGVRPGQSKFLGSSWPSAEIRLFQQMAFGSQDHSGSLDKVT